MAKPLSSRAGASISAALVLSTLVSTSAAAETISLKPGDSVQGAIDKAPDGAVIELAPGTYEERIYLNKPVTIRGTGEKPSVIKPRTLVPEVSPQETADHRMALSRMKDDQERAIAEIEYRIKNDPPVILVAQSDGVTIENLRISTPPADSDEVRINAVVEIMDASLTMKHCEVIGPWANGVFVGRDCGLHMTNSLVASMWGTGVLAFGSSGEEKKKKEKIVIAESEVRNCLISGIFAGKETDISIDRCRVSGTGGNGIRYDNCSPSITNSIISGNAGSGIYAYGRTNATVTGNVFWKNEKNGMSCWYFNKDKIRNNSFVGNQSEGLAILGESSPTVGSNIFDGHKTAIVVSLINSPRRQGAQTYGEPEMSGNLFWQNEKNAAKPGDEPGKSFQEIPPGSGAVLDVDPGFVNAEAGNFALTANSPARQKKIGTADPMASKSPWELNGEELLIIPHGESRAPEEWRRPASQEDARLLGSVRSAAVSWANGVARIKDSEKKRKEIDDMKQRIELLLKEKAPRGK